MANTIKRVQQFKSELGKFTAWITVDEDMNVVYKPEELSKFSNLPDDAWPPVIIKNDVYPDEYYTIYCGEYESMSVSHYYKSASGTNEIDSFDMGLEMDEKELSCVDFDGSLNILDIYFGDADDDYITCEIPCNIPLAAYILNGSVFAEYLEKPTSDYLRENGFPGIGDGYQDYTLED